MAAEDVKSTKEPPATGARLLVVDDSATVRAAIEQALVGPPMMAKVTLASDGAEALKMALSESFDAVICDLKMPNMDGMTFLRMIRVHRSRLELPVIVLTVREGLATKVEGFRNGASDFIIKPCDTQELLVRMETHVSLKRMYERTEQLKTRLKILVDTDPLTGLKNRRAFMRQLRSECSRAKRLKRPMALMMLDVDHFKQINDRLGHPVGDVVLGEIATRLGKSARKYDIVARVGGEEFAVIMPEISVEDAITVAERLRTTICDTPIDAAKGLDTSVSLGVSIFDENDDDQGESLLRKADHALYRAKSDGRNCLRLAGQEDDN